MDHLLIEPSAPPETCIGATRKSQFIEAMIFLFLIMPSVIISLFAYQQGGVRFPTLALSIIFRDVALVALVLFFLWHNGEPRRRIGWTARGFGTEILVGIFLFVPLASAAGGVAYLLREAGLSLPAGPPAFLLPRGDGELALATFLVIIVAVAEETIFRGYLLLRFTRITGSTVYAVLLSSFIFSLGHGYEGSAGLIAVGFLGALYALVYLWRGSIVAPATMHFLQNFIGLVLAPGIAGAL
jgi:membrane protease YdiL (CAAX protease family)